MINAQRPVWLFCTTIWTIQVNRDLRSCPHSFYNQRNRQYLELFGQKGKKEVVNLKTKQNKKTRSQIGHFICYEVQQSWVEKESEKLPLGLKDHTKYIRHTPESVVSRLLWKPTSQPGQKHHSIHELKKNSKFSLSTKSIGPPALLSPA